MKKILIIFAFATLFLASCNKSDGSTYVQAIVTVCGDQGEKCTFNLDDNTVLVPDNLERNPYAKECRALTQYKDFGSYDTLGIVGKQFRKISVISVDSVLTKDLAPDLGATQNDLVYGTDPIDLYRSWLTVVEDGYVTIHFTGKWGYPGTVHSINLVKDTDPEDPFHFELRHNYNGDVFSPYRFINGVAAFNIQEVLAKNPQSTYDIRLTYKGHDRDKDITFHYTPGATATLGNEEGDSVVGGNYIK